MHSRQPRVHLQQSRQYQRTFFRRMLRYHRVRNRPSVNDICLCTRQPKGLYRLGLTVGPLAGAHRPAPRSQSLLAFPGVASLSRLPFAPLTFCTVFDTLFSDDMTFDSALPRSAPFSSSPPARLEFCAPSAASAPSSNYSAVCAYDLSVNSTEVGTGATFADTTGKGGIYR